MIYLLLTIILNVALFIIFRLFPKYTVNTLQAIVVNYFTCATIGLLFLGFQLEISDNSWVPYTILLGGLFVTTFNLVAYSVEKAGITATEVANKISMIIPITISLLFIKHENLSLIKITAFLLALASIILSSWKNESGKEKTIFILLLPAIVFITGGMVDASINFINFRFLTPSTEQHFTIIVFLSAAIFGSLIVGFLLLTKKTTLQLKNVIAGIILGIPNYFSVYFLLKSLTAFDHNGAFVFSFMNVSVIILASFFSIILFKERLNKLNYLGTGLALLCIVLLYLEVNIR